MALKSVDRSLSVFVGNLSSDVPLKDVEEVVYELFVQAGPVNGIKVEPRDTAGLYHKGYAFVQFLHEESIPYASSLLNGITLYGRRLRVSPSVQDGRSPQSLLSPSLANAQNQSSPGGQRSHPGVALPGPSPHWVDHARVTTTPSPLRHRPGLGQVDDQYPSTATTPRAGAGGHGEGPLLSPPVLGGGAMGYVPLDGSLHHSPPVTPDNPRLHQWRVEARDHPQWISDETRTSLSEYHERHIPPTRRDSVDRRSLMDHSPSDPAHSFPDHTRGEYPQRASRTSPSFGGSREFPRQPPQQHFSPQAHEDSAYQRRHSYDDTRRSSYDDTRRPDGSNYRSRYN